MADDQTPNRAELEYTARVDEQSFRTAREQIRREVEQTAQQTRQGASTASSGGDAELEEIRRVRAERDRERQERNAARIADANSQRIVSDEEFRIMARLNVARNRADEEEIKGKRRVRDEAVKLAAEKAKAEELAYRSGAAQNVLYPGIGPANFNLTGGYRSSLLARAGPDELSAFRESLAGGAGGGGGGSFTGRGFNRFAERRAIAEAGYLVGAPEVGQVASLAAYGPQFAAVGGTLAAVAATVKAVEAYDKERKAIQDLNRELVVTNQSFGVISASTEAFASQLNLSNTEALTLSTSLAAAADKAGLKLSNAQTGQLANLLQNRGFDAKQQEQFIKQIGTDLPTAFEEVTKRNPAVFLDEYAKSIGTTSERLTILQKNQALFNEILKRSGDGALITAAHVNSLGGEYERLYALFKSGLATTGQVAVGVATDIVAGLTFQGKSYGDYTYQAGIQDEDAKQAELNRRAIADRLRKTKQESDIAILSAQQEALQSSQERFKDIGKISEISPLGVNPQKQLQALREQQQALESYIDNIRKRTDIESSAQKKLLDEGTDKLRANLKSQDSLFEDTAKKVVDFSKTFRDSFDELARLRLPGEHDNPYVKIFADGELAAAKAKERFALAGGEVVEQIVRAQNAMRNAEVFELRLKDNLSAVKLEFQAAELSKPFVGLTKAMKDTVEVFQKELQVITKVPELQAQARGVRGSGFGGLNPLYVPGTPEFIANQLNELLYKRVAYTATPGRGGDEIREQINKQITDIFAKAAPSVQRELLQRSDFKEIIAQSYEGQAGFVKDQVDYQRQLNEQSSSKVREAQTLLQELNRLGGGNESERLTRLVQGLPVAALSGEEQKLSPAELQGRKDTIRQRYLDIVGGLSREELTPDLVKGIPPELREQARFTRDREQRAKDAVGATENLQKSMETYLNKMLDSIKARNDKVLIEVTDKTTSAQVHTLGQSFE